MSIASDTYCRQALSADKVIKSLCTDKKGLKRLPNKSKEQSCFMFVINRFLLNK